MFQGILVQMLHNLQHYLVLCHEVDGNGDITQEELTLCLHPLLSCCHGDVSFLGDRQYDDQSPRSPLYEVVKLAQGEVGPAYKHTTTVEDMSELRSCFHVEVGHARP